RPPPSERVRVVWSLFHYAHTLTFVDALWSYRIEELQCVGTRVRRGTDSDLKEDHALYGCCPHRFAGGSEDVDAGPTLAAVDHRRHGAGSAVGQGRARPGRGLGLGQGRRRIPADRHRLAGDDVPG